MTSIGDRIRQLRKSLDLTQAKFGENIGSAPSMITMWETGARVPNERQIILISSFYDVSRDWLESGDGEMFEPKSEDEEVAYFIGQILGNTDVESSILKSFIRALLRTTPDERKVLSKIIKSTLDDYEREEEKK